jgi:WD40 repeat protein
MIDIKDVDADGRADVVVATDEQIVWFANRTSGIEAAQQIVALDTTSWIRPLTETVVVYNAQTQQVEHRLTALADSSGWAAISPDGSRLAVAADGNCLRVWELPSERFLGTLTQAGVEIGDLTYSPDGSQLLVARGDELHVFAADDGRLLHILDDHENTINRVIFSGDGQLAATMSDDMSVRVWSLADWQPIHTLVGHKSQPSDGSFSLDGRRLATGARDGTIRVWDIVTGQQLLTFREVGRINGDANIFTIQDMAFCDERTLIAAIRMKKPSGIHLAQWRAKGRDED